MRVELTRMEEDMPKPYSIDLREKIVTTYNQGEESMRSLAKRFKVSLSFVYTLLKKVNRSGKIEAKAHGGGHPASIDERGPAALKKIIEAQADLTLEEIRDEYNKHFDPVSRSSIDRTLKKLKISQKKRVYSTQEETALKIKENYRIIERV